MKIIFWGTPIYAVPILEKLIKSEHEIIAVVTQPDRKRGRGSQLCPSPIKQIASKNNILVITPDNIKKDCLTFKKLEELNADIYIVVAFGQILPKEFLNQPRFGCWNIHASLLPRWRGAAPIQWAILEGDEETGVAVMAMEEGLDTGDILLEKTLKIKEDDNLISLSARLSELSCSLILESLSIISSKIDIDGNLNHKHLSLISQSETNRTVKYARMIDKSDNRINWEKPAREVVYKIRGLYPNAYCIFNNKRLKILNAQRVLNFSIHNFKPTDYNSENKHVAGEIICIDKKHGIIVATTTDPIEIKVAQFEGKNLAQGQNLIQQFLAQNNNYLE